MSMWLMLCFPSWNVASAVRLHPTHTKTNTHSFFMSGPLKITASFECVIIAEFKEAHHSLFLFDGIKAGVAQPHRELEAHDGVCGAFGTTFPTYSHAALPAVVLQTSKTHVYCNRLMDSWLLSQPVAAYLSEPQGLSVPHLLDVPEERLLTLLTRVAVQPLGRLQRHTQTKATVHHAETPQCKPLHQLLWPSLV